MLVKIPSNIPDSPGLFTRELFEKCLGHTFTISGLDVVEGLAEELVRLDVGHIVGREPYLETIWVEPENLQPISA